MLEQSAAAILSVDVDAKQLTLRSKLPVSGTPVSELWAALQARGQLQEELSFMSSEYRVIPFQLVILFVQKIHMYDSKYADEILRSILEPVLSGGMILSYQLQAGLQSKDVAILCLSPANKSHNPEACCQQLLKLVAEYLFNWDEDLLQKWGEVFWRCMSDAYVRLHATPFMRLHADDSLTCSEKAQAAKSLEEFAESLGVVDGEKIEAGTFVDVRFDCGGTEPWRTCHPIIIM